MTARNGSQYLEGIDDARCVWLGGKRVDVPREPAFAGSLSGMAGYFDWQLAHADDCLVKDPVTAAPMSASLIVPRSADDLSRRHRCFERLARYSCGMLAIDKGIGELEGVNGELAARVVRRTGGGEMFTRGSVLEGPREEWRRVLHEGRAQWVSVEGDELVRGVDVRESALRTYLNGKVVEQGEVAEMTFGVDYQLADLCRHITLLPGDVVLTGTPAYSRPMQPGDVVEVEVSGLGRLTNTVVEIPAPRHDVGHQPTDSKAVRAVALGSDSRK